jgi:CHAD domain-containing protein
MSGVGAKRSFELLSAFPAERIKRELYKAGYSFRPETHASRHFTFYDTQGGKFFKKGRRLVYCPDSREIFLLQGDRELSRAEITPGDMLEKERLFIDIGGAGADKLIYLPYVRCLLEIERYRVEDNVPHRSTVSVETWRFTHPRKGKSSGELRFLTVGSLEAQPDVSFLSTILTNLIRVREVDFDPLTWGLRGLTLPLPGAPVPAVMETRTWMFPDTDAEGMEVQDTGVPGTERGGGLFQTAVIVLHVQGYKMWANTEGTLSDLDPEFLHDLRVATRRARFALRVFRGILDTGYARRLRAELAWIGELLGGVRDIDVMGSHLQKHFGRARVAPEVEKAVADELSDRRRKSLAPMCEALRSPRYGRILRSLASPVPAPDTDVKGKDVTETDVKNMDVPGINPAGTRAAASALILKRLRKVDRLLKGARRHYSPEELHALRIAFKGLRYTCEFLAQLYHDDMEPFLKSIVSFQDCLGLYQDSNVTLEMLVGVFESKSPWNQASCLSFGALFQVQREVMNAQLGVFEKRAGKYPRLSRDLASLLKKSRTIGGPSPVPEEQKAQSGTGKGRPQ